eukprot:SAG11_NODE_233_length_11903_cov_4.983650_8_plen_544_part_00
MTRTFEQRVGHRTQLVLDTGKSVPDLDDPVEGDRDAAELMGPTPYKYVAYSTVNPTQSSPIFDGNYQVVCPVCAHPAYCEMTSDVIPGTVFGPSHHVPADSTSETWTAYGEDFDGCFQITYKGYAPIYDQCANGPVDSGVNHVYVGNSWTRPAGVFTPATCTIGGDENLRSQELQTAYQHCSGLTEFTYTHNPEVGVCIDDTSGDDVTDQAVDENDPGLSDDCPDGSTWVPSADLFDTCIDQFGNDAPDTTCDQSTPSSCDETVCEGTASGNTWTDAFCTITIKNAAGDDVAVVYDGDDVRGADGVANAMMPVDKYLCETAAAPQIILPSPGLKSARQYTAAAARPPTANPATFNTGHYMPEQQAGMNSHAPCRPAVADFDGVTGIIQRVAMGGEDPAWLSHMECWDKVVGNWAECAGNLKAVAEPCADDATSCDPTAVTLDAGVSDFRIRADGSPVLRDIPRIDDYCRYCDRPGLRCDEWAVDDTPPVGSQCIKDTVNGGDTAPNTANWQHQNYVSGPSWRGDLSSGAQLVLIARTGIQHKW